MDVVVTDGKGNPIPGLRRRDLQVLEDGVPQTIVSFEAFAGPRRAGGANRPSAAPPPRVSTNTGKEEGRKGRTFVIVFDDVHLTAATAQRAKAAIAEFLRTEHARGRPGHPGRHRRAAPGGARAWRRAAPRSSSW